MTGFDLHITLLMALDGLRSVVDRFGPEHKNEGACRYAVERSGVLTPVCIVGQFFHDLGILRTLIAADGPNMSTGEAIGEGWETKYADTGYCNLDAFGGETLDVLRNRYGITFDPAAITLLKSAQTLQDGGATWADAVENAAMHVMEAHNLTPPDTRTAVERLNACIEDEQA